MRGTLRASAAAGAVALALTLPAAVAGARTGAAPAGANTYSPATGHSYRHGVLPTIARHRLMRHWASERAARTSSSQNLSYGGGVKGVGVTSGHEKVYLVFLGSQWGAQATNANGDITLAGDPNGAAPYLQELFKGLGTGSERWSGVMTQYCDGVPYNAQSCPANSFHVAYPAGGALAGVWVDESAAAPNQATGSQLGAEAISAAQHFGNSTQASNRDAQYAIISPSATHPDGFNTPRGGGFCAWHDDTADPNLPGGPVNSPLDVAFTNMPYVTDLGQTCGENFVNRGAAGVNDGFSIVLGHEYAETITDQLPAFGWTNVASSQENADLCAWNPVGTAGGTNNLKLTTGTFAMQSTWANDNAGGGCEFTRGLVTNNWVLNGGFETGTLAKWTASGTTAIANSGSHSGRFAARLGQSAPTNADSSIAQTFTARGPHFSFWYNGNCPDTVAESWATAVLTDNTAHSAVTVLARTCTASLGWQKVGSTVIAGHSYTIRITSHDDNDGAQRDGNLTLVDDVIDK